MIRNKVQEFYPNGIISEDGANNHFSLGLDLIKELLEYHLINQLINLQHAHLKFKFNQIIRSELINVYYEFYSNLKFYNLF